MSEKDANVLIVPFQTSITDLKGGRVSLGNLTTCIIFSPHKNVTSPKFMLAGGIMEAEETIFQTAQRKLKLETGIQAPIDQMYVKNSVSRISADGQPFVIYLVFAFGCDFSQVFQQTVGECGPAKEYCLEVYLQELFSRREFSFPGWNESYQFLPQHWKILSRAK